VGVDLRACVDQIYIIPIALRNKFLCASYRTLEWRSKNPAGHRVGNAVIGKLEE